MIRPSKSRFMGRDYKITIAPAGSIIVDEAEAWGETDHATQTIRIEDGLHHDQERVVALHEVLHQMVRLTGVDFTDDVEEKVCTALDDAIIGHMRDNPAFWRYLLQRPPK